MKCRSVSIRLLASLLLAGLCCASPGCASGDSAIHLTSLDPDLGIVLKRRHDPPDPLVWVREARLQLDGNLHLADENGREVPGVVIPANFSAIRVDSTGRVYVASDKGGPQFVGRVIVVPREVFDATVRAHPNAMDALEAFWKQEPEDVRLLHVGTPAK